MASDWHPASLPVRIPFHANFNQAVATGTTHGLVAEQVTQMTADKDAHRGARRVPML
jgi:hypothetical protein